MGLERIGHEHSPANAAHHPGLCSTGRDGVICAPRARGFVPTASGRSSKRHHAASRHDSQADPAVAPLVADEPPHLRIRESAHPHHVLLDKTGGLQRLPDMVEYTVHV
jgi:hypothetical protein